MTSSFYASSKSDLFLAEIRISIVRREGFISAKSRLFLLPNLVRMHGVVGLFHDARWRLGTRQFETQLFKVISDRQVCPFEQKYSCEARITDMETLARKRTITQFDVKKKIE